MASGGDRGVDPETLPKSKFGSGNPHTQTANDDQGIVTGCDELKDTEAAPAAVTELAEDVMQQQKDFTAGRGGGSSDPSAVKAGAERSTGQSSAQLQGKGQPPEGAAAGSDAYGGDDM